MTKKITDLEGRLDAALSRMDRKGTTKTPQGHTPGPWKVAGAFTVTTGQPFAADVIADTQYIDDGRGYDHSGSATETRRANAHLIAAAPELLAALEVVKGFWTRKVQNGVPPRLTLTIVAQVCAAIAKAQDQEVK